jgi:hypothetical protein
MPDRLQYSSDLNDVLRMRISAAPGGHRIGAEGILMLYKKIDVELIVAADEAEAVAAALNSSLDQLDEKYTLFGGEIETATFEHRGTRRMSALEHTIAAGESVGVALRTARSSLVAALRAVV